MSALPVLAPSRSREAALPSGQGSETPASGQSHPWRDPGAEGAVLNAMAGGIVHDLRSILAVIAAGAALAERHADEPERLRNSLAALRDAARRGAGLVSRLLDLAIGARHDPRPHDINALICRSHAFLGYAAGPGIAVNLRPARALPPCLLDAGRFEAVMLKLMVNARDAMPHGGTIEIATAARHEQPPGESEPRPFVHLRVTDHGIGMSPGVLRKVFDPYFTTKGEAGTGLGLPQVREFVRGAGGYVEVDSVRGAGTTFDLAFPALARPGAPEDSDRQHHRRTERSAGTGSSSTGAGGASGKSPASAARRRAPARPARPAGRFETGSRPPSLPDQEARGSRP